MTRLVEHDLHAAGQHHGHLDPESGGLRLTPELDALLPQIGDRGVDVVAHQRQLVPRGVAGMHADLGYRWGPVEPQGNFYWFNSDTKKNSFLKIAGGLNLFFVGHRAKIQAEFASIITNTSLERTPALHQIIVQAQLAL